MKKYFIILFTLVSLNLSAQIEDEIRSFVDSSEIIIKNGRRLMTKNLTEGNLAKANEVYSYLVVKNNGRSSAAFSYDEDMCLNLLLGNFQTWADKAINYSTTYTRNNNTDNDDMYPLLQEIISKKEKELSTAIAQSPVNDEDKALMYLYLYLIATNRADDMYFSQLKDFKRNFPQNRYFNFLNYYLPKEKTRASFAYGFGASGVFPTGNLSNSFKSNAVFNASVDFNVGKIYASVIVQGGGLISKKQIELPSGNDIYIFDKGESFSYFDGGFIMGYFVQRTNWVHVAPFAGIMGTTLTTNMYSDPEDDKYEIELINAFTTGIGLKTEFKIHEFELQNFYGYGYYQKSYVSLKLEGGYNFVTKAEIDEFKGNVAYIRATLMWGFGSF